MQEVQGAKYVTSALYTNFWLIFASPDVLTRPGLKQVHAHFNAIW